MIMDEIENTFFLKELNFEQLPSNLTVFVGFLLNKTAQLIKNAGDHALKQYNITTQHIGLLLYLLHQPNSSQIDISNATLIDRTTMVNLIDELEAEKLVERTRNPNDRRKYQVTLTNKGREMIPVFTKLMEDTENSFLSLLTIGEKENLVNALIKLIVKK